jgi:hypothetical protein
MVVEPGKTPNISTHADLTLTCTDHNYGVGSNITEILFLGYTDKIYKHIISGVRAALSTQLNFTSKMFRSRWTFLRLLTTYNILENGSCKEALCPVKWRHTGSVRIESDIGFLLVESWEVPFSAVQTPHTSSPTKIIRALIKRRCVWMWNYSCHRHVLDLVRQLSGRWRHIQGNMESKRHYF